jgi:hypothetical protein
MSNTHQEVASAWRCQTGKTKRGFNVFYEGDTIYSYGYHFPIAKLVQSPRHNGVILFTTDTYSVSTAKHKTIVWRECYQSSREVFDVPNVNASTNDEHVANWRYMLSQQRHCYDKAKRARVYKQSWLDQANTWRNMAHDYGHEFDIKYPW